MSPYLITFTKLRNIYCAFRSVLDIRNKIMRKKDMIFASRILSIGKTEYYTNRHVNHYDRKFQGVAGNHFSIVL